MTDFKSADLLRYRSGGKVGLPLKQLRRKPKFTIPSVLGAAVRVLRQQPMRNTSPFEIAKDSRLTPELARQFYMLTMMDPRDDQKCCYCKRPTPKYEGVGRVFAVLPDPPTRKYLHGIIYTVCDDCVNPTKEETISRFHDFFYALHEDQRGLWLKHLELEAMVDAEEK